MLVIYKSLDSYYVTTLENYNAQIQDKNKIQKMDGFKSPELIIEYFCEYFNVTKNDFIVKE